MQVFRCFSRNILEDKTRDTGYLMCVNFAVSLVASSSFFYHFFFPQRAPHTGRSRSSYVKSVEICDFNT